MLDLVRQRVPQRNGSVFNVSTYMSTYMSTCARARAADVPALNSVVVMRFVRMLPHCGLISPDVRKRFIGHSTLSPAARTGVYGLLLWQFSSTTALPDWLNRRAYLCRRIGFAHTSA